MNTNFPLKLINPLSDFPTEMWLQAIADFEALLVTPGYEVNMDLWCVGEEKQSVCYVCMAGASMVRRSQGRPREVILDIFSEQDMAKFESINCMRRGHFRDALTWLSLEEQDYKRWIEAIKAAESCSLLVGIRDANETHDWRGLIELLREAIARIDAEYERLPK